MEMTKPATQKEQIHQIWWALFGNNGDGVVVQVSAIRGKVEELAGDNRQNQFVIESHTKAIDALKQSQEQQLTEEQIKLHIQEHMESKGEKQGGKSREVWLILASGLPTLALFAYEVFKSH